MRVCSVTTRPPRPLPGTPKFVSPPTDSKTRKVRNTYSRVLLSSRTKQCNATTTNQGRDTHMTPVETNRVGHKAEATLGTLVETMQQPGENDISPQARPPQTSTRSRAHKQNHLGPRTHREVEKPHTPMPPWTGTK
ncbi:hypothetical protein Taro_014078, partial [Colocasia esculenta]|nr:hypothetical protein [Colocasia esculenta]